MPISTALMFPILAIMVLVIGDIVPDDAKTPLVVIQLGLLVAQGICLWIEISDLGKRRT